MSMYLYRSKKGIRCQACRLKGVWSQVCLSIHPSVYLSIIPSICPIYLGLEKVPDVKHVDYKRVSTMVWSIWDMATTDLRKFFSTFVHSVGSSSMNRKLLVF